MTHESNLKLQSGPDRVLVHLYNLLLVCALIAFAFSPIGPLAKAVGSIVCLIFALHTAHCRHKSKKMQLLIHPDGRVKWKDSNLVWQYGSIDPKIWAMSHYAVIKVLSGNQVRRILISRSGQPQAAYRTFLSWVRLNIWQTDY
ncbi:MAG: hypothetical protein ACI9H8_000896 [Lysobacterales bacterium]